MALQLQYFQASLLGSYLVDAWQNHLQTEADPTDGRWFVNGPNNGPGLLGGLQDQLATNLVLDQGQMSVNKTPQVAATATADNRNGLLTSATTTVNWTVTTSATSTQSTSDSIKAGISQKIAVEVADVKLETTISFDYTYSWSDTQSTTHTQSESYSEQVPLTVPAGRVYKVIVLGDSNAITIPYSAQIFLTGVSQTNFANPVNGQSNWSTDAGTICNWINQYGSAGNDKMQFGADPTNPQRGIASLHGTMNVNQSANFTIYAFDVTSSYNADPNSTALINQLLSSNIPTGTVLTQPVQNAAPS
jgi:hypothetical protein